jgi:hypothetical protein
MDNVRFEFYRGRTYTRDFTIVGYDDKVDEVYFTVCENENNKRYCIRKTLNNGITIADEGINENGEKFTTYNLLIEATDTDHMKANYEYGFDIAIVSGSKKLQVITGIMLLDGTYTKTCNECL